MAITESQAYIAIRPDGFVEGASFTETDVNANDVKEWKADMVKQGFKVKIVDRQYAKDVLFKNISTLAA